MISSGAGKNVTSQTPCSTLPMDEWTRYLSYRDTIKLSKYKTHSKVVKSHQCSPDKFHALSSVKLNSELQWRPGSFYSQKQILRSTRHKHLQKQTMKISLFNYTMLGYILPIAISLPLRKEILGQSHIFESIVQTDNLFSVAFQTNLLFFNKDLCRYLQACLL